MAEVKRPGTHICRKVRIPDIFPFLDRSLPLYMYGRICTTESQMIADAAAYGL